MRYLLMIPLLSFIGLGMMQAQSGCTFGWSADPDENFPALPGATLPPALGQGQVPYMDIIISIETGCQERLEFNNIGFSQPGCNIIEYFNSRGEFIGAEHLEYPSTSTVIFDGSDLDGIPGTPGYPSGVNPGTPGAPNAGCGVATASAGNGPGAAFPFQPDYGGSDVGGSTGFPPNCEYYPGNCNNRLPGAETGQIIYFRNVPGDFATYQYTGLGSNSSAFRAVRIVSVVERTSPIIMGPYEQNLCNTMPIILDNGPSHLAGDPRYSNVANVTNTSIAGLSPELLIEITANNPTRFDTATGDARNGKIRALLCTESTDPYRGGPGSTLNLSMTGPGIGYLDADADGNGIGDIPNTLDSANNRIVTSGFGNGLVFNNFYDNVPSTGIPGAGTSPSARGSGNSNTVYNYTTNPDFNDVPDLCGGVVTTSFFDLFDRNRRAQIYGTQPRDYATADGRFRMCEQINRRWTATDQYGNQALWTQTIDVVDDYRGRAMEGPNFVTVMEAGSPYFQPVGTVTVLPTPTTRLTNPTVASDSNMYVAAGFLATPNYTNTLAGVQRRQNAPDTTYAYPVFSYAMPTQTFDCSELDQLDGFAPAPADNCGIFATLPIDDLFDYGSDGDFGDVDSVGTLYYYDNTRRYNANGTGAGTSGVARYVNPSLIVAGDTLDDLDDNPLAYDPFDRESYNYDLLKRWVVEDDCGFRSIAQRIYRIRDEEAPMIPSLTVTVSSNGAVLAYTPTLTADRPAVTGFTPNIKEYEISNVNIVDPTCTPSINIDAEIMDNCATPYVVASYTVNTVSTSGITSTVSAGSLSGGSTAVPLPAEGEYVVIVNYIDPSNNFATLEIPVTTSGTVDPLNIVTPFTTVINNSNIGTVDYLDVAPYSNIINFLSNLCDIPSCVELVIRSTDAFNNPMEDRAIYQVQTSPSLQLIGLGSNNDPLLTFNCNDIGQLKNVEVEIHRVSNCNTTTTPPSRNLSSVVSLLDSQTSSVSIIGSPNAAFTIQATAVAASTGVANSGGINVQVTEAFNTPTQNYNVTFTNTVTQVTGMITNVNIAQPQSNPIQITGLDPGTYSVVVTGSQSCSSQSATVIVNTMTPVGVQLDCPGFVSTGTTSFSLLAGADFTSITNMIVNISVTGVSGITLSANATAALGGGFTGLTEDSNNPGNFQFSFATNTLGAVTAAVGTPLVNFQLDIPASTPPNTTISIGAVGSATQTSGTGTMSLSLSPVSCQIVTSNITGGGTQLAAAGEVRYIYCDGTVGGVNVEISGTGVSTQNAATGDNGSFVFPATITAGSAVTITPTLSSYVPMNSGIYEIDLNDVTRVLDIILNNPMPVSPYQELAADYDGDGDVDNDDARMLFNQVTINQDPMLYNEWVFVLASQPLSLFTNKPRATLNSTFTTSAYNATNSNIDFFAYKPGDVQEDCAPNSAPVVRSVVGMIGEDRAIEKGQIYELDLHLKDLSTLRALQSVLNYDANVIKPLEVIFSDAISNGLTAGVVQDDQIKLGAATSFAGDITAEDAVITIRYEAVQDAKSIRSALQVARDANSMVTDGAKESYNLDLFFNSSALSAATLEVYGSAPNPFSTTTNINFAISTSDQVQLTVTDVTGKVVFEQSAAFDAGQHQFNLSADQLGASGVLIYTITTSDMKYTDKLLLIK